MEGAPNGGRGRLTRRRPSAVVWLGAAVGLVGVATSASACSWGWGSSRDARDPARVAEACDLPELRALHGDGVALGPAAVAGAVCDEDVVAFLLDVAITLPDDQAKLDRMLDAAVAAETTHPDAVARILDAGAEVAPEGGANALITAVQLGKADLVPPLLEAGGDPDVTIEGGQPLLTTAIGYEDEQSALALVAGGADPDARWTLSYWDILVNLLTMGEGDAQRAVGAIGPGIGIDPGVVDAFTSAEGTMEGFQAVADLPGEFDLDQEVGDASALWLATVHGEEAVVDALLAAGADPKIGIGDLQTPREAAAALGAEEIELRLAAVGG